MLDISDGYMARAAYLMDGVMARAGLSGKAFLPLFSSYACAIPGVMATRTIDSAKERLVTIFVAPWMSCSARLPVYFLIVPLLLHEDEGTWRQALVLFAIYTLGTLTAFGVARLLRRKLGPDTGARHFLLELPPYRAPQWSYIFRHVFERGRAFVAKAGTIILGLSILLWALGTYPKMEGDDEAEALAHSAMGRIGAVIEPVVQTARLRRPRGHRHPDILRRARGLRFLDGGVVPRRGNRTTRNKPAKACANASPPPNGRMAGRCSRRWR